MPARDCLAVGLIVLGCALLVARGQLGGGPDEELVFLQAESLLRDRDLAFDAAERQAAVERCPSWAEALREGPAGTWTAVYGPLQAILTVPLIAPAGEHGRRVAAACLLNPVLLALTAALMACWLAELGLPRWARLVCPLAYALATFALAYAKTYLSEPLSALCLTTAAYGAYRSGRGDRAPRPGAAGGVAVQLAGFAFAAAILTRPHNLILAAPLAALLGRRPRLWVAFAAAPLAACAWWAWANHSRFGSPADFGYLPEVAGAASPANLPVGLVGLLLSPGRGLVWYAPIVVLAIPGYRAWGLPGPREAGVARCLLAAVLVQWCCYALRDAWWGNWCWGPRYLLPVLPLLCLLAAPAFDRPTLVVLPAVLGALGAAAGLLVYNGLYQGLILSQPNGLTRLLWFPLDSPLCGHWRFAFTEGGRYLDLFCLQALRLHGSAAAAGWAAPRAVPLLAGLWLLTRAGRREPQP